MGSQRRKVSRIGSDYLGTLDPVFQMMMDNNSLKGTVFRMNWDSRLETPIRPVSRFGPNGNREERWVGRVVTRCSEGPIQMNCFPRGWYVVHGKTGVYCDLEQVCGWSCWNLGTGERSGGVSEVKNKDGGREIFGMCSTPTYIVTII